jgi:nucleoside 2-deoxyribosyltransferase
MKIYIAAKLTNHLLAQEALKLIRDAGHEVAHEWMLTHDPDKPETIEQAIQSCKDELLELEYAKGLLFILPGGRGAHVELGYALAKDIPIVFYSVRTDPDMIGFYGDRKVHFDLKDAVIDLLGQMLKEWEHDPN